MLSDVTNLHELVNIGIVQNEMILTVCGMPYTNNISGRVSSELPFSSKLSFSNEKIGFIYELKGLYDFVKMVSEKPS